MTQPPEPEPVVDRLAPLIEELERVTAELRQIVETVEAERQSGGPQ